MTTPATALARLVVIDIRGDDISTIAAIRGEVRARLSVTVATTTEGSGGGLLDGEEVTRLAQLSEVVREFLQRSIGGGSESACWRNVGLRILHWETEGDVPGAATITNARMMNLVFTLDHPAPTTHKIESLNVLIFPGPKKQYLRTKLLAAVRKAVTRALGEVQTNQGESLPASVFLVSRKEWMKRAVYIPRIAEEIHSILTFEIPRTDTRTITSESLAWEILGEENFLSSSSASIAQDALGDKIVQRLWRHCQPDPSVKQAKSKVPLLALPNEGMTERWNARFLVEDDPENHFAFRSANSMPKKKKTKRSASQEEEHKP